MPGRVAIPCNLAASQLGPNFGKLIEINSGNIVGKEFFQTINSYDIEDHTFSQTTSSLFFLESSIMYGKSFYSLKVSYFFIRTTSD